MMKMTPRRVTFLSLALAILSVGCNGYRQLKEQLPTFANLQDAAIHIERVATETGALPTTEEARKIVAEHLEDAKDLWGSEILYVARTSPKQSFLLISLGRDRKLDVPDPSVYFGLESTMIVGDLNRDIVFRDGVAVTNAGKP